ncbi:large subunit ribosomal protein L34e, partial [Phenoliferia sp. Uapishka_3]
MHSLTSILSRGRMEANRITPTSTTALHVAVHTKSHPADDHLRCGKLRYLCIKKLPTSPKCGDCHIALPGIPALRPRQYSQISKRQKTVQRAYGGSRCATCVRDRIVRSFLVEEAKIVKKVIKSQGKAKK